MLSMYHFTFISCNISKDILNKILYTSIFLQIIYCAIQVKEIKQKITSNAEDFIQLDECLNSFFINKIIENEEFLLTSELLNTYEFHKIKDEKASMVMMGDIIAILDSSYRFLKLQLKYSNSSLHNQEIKIISGGSYDLKIINDTNNQYNIQDLNNTENKQNFKMLQSSQSDQLFILSERRLYKVSINNPLDSIVKGNHLYFFADLKNKIDDITYYSEKGLFFIASGGDVFIYQESTLSSLQLNFMGKVKGLQYDLLEIKKLMIYQDILLVVDQQNGIFFIGLPNNQNSNIQQQQKQFRTEIQRLPLQIIASDVVDIYMNDKTVIVIESEESNSQNVIITEYYYNLEQSLVMEVKEIVQRYSNYQKGAIISDKFFFISNFAIHYIFLLQNYSKSSKAISSVFDKDDFYYSDDKIVTNTMSVRIHNLIALDSFKDYNKPLLIGLESKKLSVYNLEFSSPLVDIKYNDSQQQEDDDNNDIKDNSDTYTNEEISQNNLRTNNGTNKLNEQKSKQQAVKKQLTTSCAVFDCSSILKNFENQLQLDKIQKDQIQINTQIYDEYDVLVFTDFCIITKEIDIVPLVAITWFDLLVQNEYLYYGLLSSIVFLPIIILISKAVISIKCKCKFNINIFTPMKKKIKSDKQFIVQTQQAEENQNGLEQFQIDEQMQSDEIHQNKNKSQKNVIINEVNQNENQKMRVKKIGIYSVGNKNQQDKQVKQHQQTASDYSKINGINLPNELKESVKQFQKPCQSQQDQYKYYQSQSKTAKSSKSSYPPEETPQNTAPLVTEVLNTENVQTEGDDKPLFKVTKLNHDNE